MHTDSTSLDSAAPGWSKTVHETEILWKETRNLSSHIETQTHAGRTLHDSVTLTFDLLTSESMHVEVLPWSICLPNLVLIAQAVFLLANTDTTDDLCAFNALKLLVGQQEGHPDCKKLEWWDAGVVIWLGRGADLHMVQMIPLLLTVSCSRKSRLVLVLPFSYRLMWVVPCKMQTAINGWSSSSSNSNNSNWSPDPCINQLDANNISPIGT